MEEKLKEGFESLIALFELLKAGDDKIKEIICKTKK